MHKRYIKQHKNQSNVFDECGIFTFEPHEESH